MCRTCIQSAFCLECQIYLIISLLFEIQMRTNILRTNVICYSTYVKMVIGMCAAVFTGRTVLLHELDFNCSHCTIARAELQLSALYYCTSRISTVRTVLLHELNFNCPHCTIARDGLQLSALYYCTSRNSTVRTILGLD